ncbi:melatonin receptor type 1B-B-like [Acanthaster planci]|uniref:Melatonin receptor type 1B-B-like n=1 Tax=Acanthaster planci TaxID=133434 RepID=A0A8B7XQE9_ACAPL|nr:melatonin receptor type 1B-B-like [Acanthaster planci]XP_022082402.1 melatonin receptor type 1B-B-like [Acanthaster planci]
MELVSNASQLASVGGNLTSPSLLPLNESEEIDLVESEYAGRFAYGERIALAVAMSIITVLGTFGNGLVILAVALSRKLRTATNVYVVSLSTTDLLTCLCLPWHVLGAVSMNGWPIAKWICSAAGGLTIIFVGSSIITLAFIALNRLFLITQPSTRYRTLYTFKMLMFTTLVAWLLPFVTVIIPPLLGVGKLGYDEKYLRCGPVQSPGGTLSNPYDMIVAAVLYPIPMIAIVVCYAKIFLYIKHHTKTILAPSEHSSSSNPKSPAANNNGTQHHTSSVSRQSSTRKRLSRRQVEITKNLFYVVCAFVLCLSPYSIGIMIPSADHFTPYAGVILLLNSCVNPLIYAAKHPYFRTIFICIVTLKFSKIPEPSNLLRYALSTRDDYSK